MQQKFIYITGYIDGDGCFFLQKTGKPFKYRSKVIISSTNKKVLQSFKKDFGGNILPVKTYFAHYKQQFHWYISGIKFLEFFSYIYPFLIEKKKDAFYFKKFILTKNKITKEKIMKDLKEHRFLNKQITKEVFDDIKKTKSTNSFNEIDAAYLAGFIDAECHLGISKYRRKGTSNYLYKIILSCNNTSPNIFYWFKEKIGGCFCFIDRHSKNKLHRNQINWNISGKKLFSILKKVHPFIRSKKKVSEKLIEFYQLSLPNGGDRQSIAFKKAYSEILLKKEKIVDIVHKLNSKGK